MGPRFCLGRGGGKLVHQDSGPEGLVDAFARNGIFLNLLTGFSPQGERFPAQDGL